MAINYPNSLDNFTNPTSSSPINSPSHSEQHANANDAIEAIEGELGTNPKGAKATVKARLDDVDTAIATKAPIASPTFTGTVTIPLGSSISGIPYLATANTFTGGIQQINTLSASTKGLIIKGSLSQSANLQEWQTSTGALVGWVDGNGSAFFNSNFQINGVSAIGTSPQSTSQLIVKNNSASRIGLVVQATSSQSANLQEWQNSSGGGLALIDQYGNLVAQGIHTYYAAIFQESDPALTPVTVQGAPSQTANLQSWQDSSYTTLSSISSSGVISGRGLLISTSTNTTNAGTFYNAAGTPVFNVDTSLNAINIGGGLSGVANNFASTWGYDSGLNAGYMTFTTGALGSDSLAIRRTNHVASGDYTISTLGNFRLSTASGKNFNFNNGNIGIATTAIGTNNKIIVNPYSTVDNLATVQINTNAATNKGLVVQGFTSQTANLQEWQDSSGNILATITTAGSLSLAAGKQVIFANYIGTKINLGYGGNYQIGVDDWTIALQAENSTNIGKVAIRPAGATYGAYYVNPIELYANGAIKQNLTVASNVGLIIKAAPSQTANFQEWQNSAGTVLAYIDKDGQILTPRVNLPTNGLIVEGGTGPYIQMGSSATYLYTRSASNKGLVIQGSVSQTANLQEWQDSSGTALSYVKPDGTLYIVGNSNASWISGPATSGTNKITANGNDLAFSPYFDGLFAPAYQYGRWRPVNDATSDLGTSGQRWKDVYATSAVLNNNSISKVGLIVQAIASQTADLQQWQSSAGAALSRIAPKGNVYIGATQAGLSGQINGVGTVTQNTSPLLVRGTASGQNLIELWAYGKDAFITGAVGNGTSVTYTTSIAHGFTTSDYVIINGIAQSGGSGNLNIAGGTGVSAVTTYTFTVPNTSTQTYTSGGYVRNAEYPSNILQAYRSDGMSLFTIGGSGGFAMADVMSVANVGYQEAGLSIQPNLTSSAAIRAYGRSAQSAEILDIRNYIYKSGGSNSIFAIVPDYSVSANADGYGAWVRMRNAATPTVNPTSAGYLYVGSGALNYMGTSNVPQQIVGADGSVKFTSVASSTVGLIIKGAASQTANLQEWQNSNGTTLSLIKNDGRLWIQTNTELYATLQATAYSAGAHAARLRGAGGASVVRLETTASNTIGIEVIGASGGQTANLQEWQSEPGTVRSAVNANGFIIAGNSTAISNAIFSAQTYGASQVGIAVRGAASQTANLQEWQNSAGTVLAKISSDGTITAGNITSTAYAFLTGTTYAYNIASAADYGATMIQFNSGKNLAITASTTIASQSAGIPALSITGPSSPTTNIQEWKNSSGTVMARINSAYILEAYNGVYSYQLGSSTDGSIVANMSANGSIAFAGTVAIPTIKSSVLSTISANTATTVDTVALSSFTTIEYTLSIKQGSKVRSSKVLVHTDGTSIDSTEYGIMEMGGGITGILVTASVSSTNSILQVTITDAATTNATVKLIKTML